MDQLSKEASPLSYATIGAALEAHAELGAGFLEAVYQEAFAKELQRRGIEFEREVPVAVFYKGEPLSTPYRADFLVGGRLLVELKAIADIGRIEEAQVIHYLKATGLAAGLLLNFGSHSLQIRRLGNRRVESGTIVMDFP